MASRIGRNKSAKLRCNDEQCSIWRHTCLRQKLERQKPKITDIEKESQRRIHNYFAVKMLEKTRPGGLCVIMTSNGLLDSPNNAMIREYINQNAEVVNAVRLPNNTFKNTQVVTDLLFLRKYKTEKKKAKYRHYTAFVNNTRYTGLFYK